MNNPDKTQILIEALEYKARILEEALLDIAIIYTRDKELNLFGWRYRDDIIPGKVAAALENTKEKTN